MITGGYQAKVAGQRAARAHREAFTGGEMSVGGFVDIQEPGFAHVTVQFPVRFTQKPLMSALGELAPGTQTDRNTLPTLDALVRSWTTQRMRGADDNLLYLGCEFLVRTTGLAGQVIIMHWTAIGLAIVDPISTIDDPIEGEI